MSTVQTGLEHFIASPPKWIKGSRLGLLCNSASVDRKFQHAGRLIARQFPGKLKAIFSPQHGFFSEKQDNMIESNHSEDPVLGIPAFSLYSQTRIPTREMFDLMDVLLVDLQDVGTRVYTFASTVSYCLEVARQTGKQVMILDRPNPIGGLGVEGNCLSENCASFVGRYPIPMRHGMTMGELALFINSTFEIDSMLTVTPMKGWRRSMYYDDTGLPWIPPSPNLPTPVSAAVYPGQVIWEGTNVSEGRGTTQPFEIFGAPFFDALNLLEFLNKYPVTGIFLRPFAFEPTSNKWQGTLCRGFQIHVVDPNAYKPYCTTLALLRAVRYLYADQFKWKSPPYEYEYERLPIDLIIGDTKIRQRIEAFEEIEEIEKSWQPELTEFKEKSREFYLYD
jgi:uncharacterized protein YbbC (DUF1343 family)